MVRRPSSVAFSSELTSRHQRQQRHHLTRARFDSDSVPIAIDNCASRCITTDRSDFLPDSIRTLPKPLLVRGLSRVPVTTIGTVRWRLQDDRGVVHSFDIPNTILMSSLDHRLLSPQHLAQVFGQNMHEVTTATYVALSWSHNKYRLTIPLGNSNVAMTRTAPGFRQYAEYLQQVKDEELNLEDSIIAHPTISEPVRAVERDQPTLIPFHDEVIQTQHAQQKAVTNDQIDLLRWHNRLGHTSFHQLQHMAKQGVLPSRLQHCPHPFCAACKYGKQTRKPWRSKQQNTNLRRAKRPGQCVSVDQMHASTPGLIAQLKGIPTKHRYHYATIFVDHYSRLSYVHLQRELTSEETVQGKKAFEHFAKSHNVTIEHYHADNGRFADNLWLADVARCQQTISYCGVNAHWQNGIAEKRIRDLVDAARTILLDAKAKWPSAIHQSLWPYALRYANHLHQAKPSPKAHDTKHSPLELFSNSPVRPNLTHFHPFGCPTYLLHDKLQQQNHLDRWAPRAHLGINLGFSPTHARTVNLILNPQTGLCSPQYHCQFDDLFTTVDEPRNKAFHHGTWQHKTRFREQINKRVTHVRHHTPIAPKPTNTSAQGGPWFDASPLHESRPTTPQYDATINERTEQQQQESFNEPTEEIDEPQDTNDEPTQEDLPSKRIRKPSQRLQDHWESHAALIHSPVAHEALTSHLATPETPFCYASKKGGDPDTLSFRDAMNQPDRDEFIRAMVDEIKDHSDREHWELYPKRNVPHGHPIARAVWSMKRKRRLTTGETYKHKSRVTYDGSQQVHGLNYWDTFSPVVNAFVVKLFFVLALINGWHKRQIDFILAYPHAPAPTDLFMAIPKGFTVPSHLNPDDYCLKLRHNLYGTKQGGRAWYTYLCQGLRSLNFTQSKIDHCVWYREKTIVLFYVDNTWIFSPQKEDADRVFTDLQRANFKVTDEGEVTDFLGVSFTPLPDGGYDLRQDKLIDQVLSDMQFVPGTKPHDRPANVNKPLHRDEHLPAHSAAWNYRSIIGKLNFLLSTRADLGYAVHNAARFCQNPRASHTEAVTKIARYLLGTRDKGMQIKPTNDPLLEVYADAEFGGLWKRETAANDPSTAKSRIGYIIRYAGVPILWTSKLATEICLSVSEAEYCSLSEALRAAIPMMQLLEECYERGLIAQPTAPTVRCKVFEDNSGAVEMAKVPKLRPRTKHINVKYHHFRTFVENKQIEIVSIGTEDQIADILTKQPTQELFLRFRKAIMGW